MAGSGKEVGRGDAAALALVLGVLAGLAWSPGIIPSQLTAQSLPVLLDTLEIQVGSRVSSGLPVLTRSIRILGSQEIDALPVRSVADLLAWAVGVEVQARSPAQSDLSIRGAGFEQVVVLVDGVRMSDPQTGHFDLNLAVPLDQVERVEILRGPASALYGSDAVGGVVNVVTRQGPSGWEGRLEGGSWGSARLAGGGGLTWGGTGSVRVGGELSRSDGHRDGTDHETLLLTAKLDRPAATGRLKGDLGLARRDFGAQDFYAPYPSFERTRTYTSSLRWMSQENDELAVELGTSLRRHEDEFTLIRTDPGVYQNRHTSSQVGGDALLRTSPWNGFDLVLGGEAFEDILRSNALGDREETRAAFFGEAVFRGTGAGVLSLGARRDWHEGFESFLSPSFSGSLRISPSLRVRAAVGRSFRAPTWTERYYRDPVNVGRDDLDPERTWSGEIGLDVVRGSGLRGAVTAFVRRAENLIDWAKPEGAGAETPWETRNVEEADFLGVEAEVEFRSVGDLRWVAGAMALSVDSREALGYVSKYALRPVTQQVTIGLRRTFLDSLELGANVQRASRKGQDAYTRLDVRGSVSLGSAARVYLDGQNLLDARYPDVTGAPAPGRALFLGLEVGGRRTGR